MSDIYAEQFAKLGGELLDRTNRPNIITFEQFQPYLPLFQKIDQERYLAERPNGPYYIQLTNLFQQYIHNLGINLYQPTIVVRSKDDPTELVWLDRMFTRIQSDVVASGERSMRDQVPGGVSRVSTVSRDQQILEASLVDIMNANNTPEQTDRFTRIKMGSSLIRAKFMENNMSAEQRALVMASETPTPESGSAEPSSEAVFGVVDDDD